MSTLLQALRAQFPREVIIPIRLASVSVAQQCRRPQIHPPEQRLWPQKIVHKRTVRVLRVRGDTKQKAVKSATGVGAPSPSATQGERRQDEAELMHRSRRGRK